MPSPTKRASRLAWLIPGSIAFIVFLGGVAGNLVANDLAEFYKNHRKLVLIVFFISLAAAIIGALLEHFKAGDDKPAANHNPAPNSDTPPNQVVKIKNYYQTPPATPSPLHQIPDPPDDFTGRKAELQAMLDNLQRGVTISGLQGLGGVGKTALALKLAERLKPSYPDAQFFLDLQGASAQPVTTAAALSHVIRAYHPEARLPDTVAELLPLYQSALHGQRALLLFDNAKDRAQVEPLIPPAGCVLLVTSRAHFALPGMKEQHLDALPPDDARALLLAQCERIGAQADEVAKLCGCLPLALRVAGSFLQVKRDFPVGKYLERLRAARLRQLPEVAASLGFSYEQLPPEQQARWRALAVFPDTFDLAAVAAVWEVDEDAAQDALSEIVSYSLLDWEAATSRYRLHDLAREFASAQLSKAEHNATQLSHAQHFCEVLRKSRDLYLQGNEQVTVGLALFDRERLNIEAGLAWATMHNTTDKEAIVLCVEYPNAGDYMFDLRLTPHEWIYWLEVQRDAAINLHRRDLEGLALCNLGIAYRNLGEIHKAISFYEQALIIAREIGNQFDEGNALRNLGIANAKLDESRKAITFYEQALTIAREIGDRRGVGASLSRLGITYAKLGEYQKAIRFYEQALTIAREIGNWRGEGTALGNLGLAHADLGDPRKAIEFYQQALIIVRKIGDRRGESTALWNISLSLGKLGERVQAIACAEASLKIKEEIEDPRAAEVREQLAKWRK